MMDKYNPKLLNVHPGDTTKGYIGLHWIPSASAILAGEDSIRSTLFIVDKGEDSGSVLVQSAPLKIAATLLRLEDEGEKGIFDRYYRVTQFAVSRNIKTFSEFTVTAGADMKESLEHICRRLQDELKVAGDWKIYPFAVHDLIARGRVAIEGSKVFIDGKPVPVYGYRLED